MQRRLQKPIHEVFNDGFLRYGRRKTKRDEARKRIGEEFVEEGKLAFRLLNAREEDYRFAGVMGASLDLKVKTRYPPSFKNVRKSNLKSVIDGIEYDVIDVDRDNDKRYLYFYLQEVGVTSE
ncbi:phage head closure protein [Virgibacillus salarius]|uniref:phage head closure protein n=1 Tax=Virgibacillus salarius TaxID=447199 RepID=UPI00249134D7|nr:phage head closure protein [Virgibacillus salarius]WBX80126.1 phage head closure protein [Virgibacillus salarius]